MDRDFAAESQALADELRKAYDEADPRYFELMPDLFYLVLGAAQRQGVSKAALEELVRYNVEREQVVSGLQRQVATTQRRALMNDPGRTLRSKRTAGGAH